MFSTLPQKLLWMVVLSALTLFGCGPTIKPPQGFIQMDYSAGHDFRALSSKGYVIAVDQSDNEGRGGTLDFWSNALEYQLIDLQGFDLRERRALKSKVEEAKGKMWHFFVGQPPDQLSYFIGLYVTEDDIYTLQAVGPADELSSRIDEIQASFETIDF